MEHWTSAGFLMRYYCTYFDHNYLPRGLALIESLRLFSREFRVFVLCLSEECLAALQKLGAPELTLISLAELEKEDPPLLEAKQNRSIVEYYFTCTPALARFVLREFPEIDCLNYLDSDLFFFADPELVFTEVGDASVAITPHRFPPALQWKEKFGRFNVGWLSFRQDEQGLACVERWREQCLEWCFDRYEGNRFADQKYLDEWPVRYSRLKILEHPGINTAPWNLAGLSLTAGEDGVRVNGAPLILFHFHKVKQVNRWIYDPQWEDYGVRSHPVLRRQVYGPYLERLEAARDQARTLLGAVMPRQDMRRAQRSLSPLRRLWRASPVRPAWYGLLAAAGVLRRRKFFVWGGRVRA